MDYADDIDPAWLDGVTTVGVTSGASVPEVLVRGVLERLAEYGYDVVQPVTTANETLVFALPREIRPARHERLREEHHLRGCGPYLRQMPHVPTRGLDTEHQRHDEYCLLPALPATLPSRLSKTPACRPETTKGSPGSV